MKTLPQVKATPEQLPIISTNRSGTEVIRGAAGSGKTSTALLRLRSLLYMFQERRRRQVDRSPVRILVLAFNRTLAGYIEALALSQIDESNGLEIEISTFGKWAVNTLKGVRISDLESRTELVRLIAAANIGTLSQRYLLKEIDYVLGRFVPENLETYITVERAGRGAQPRVDRLLRRRILDEIIYPYLKWMAENNLEDWNSIAVRMARTAGSLSYDVVIVDESQDFSANQLRAVKRHLAQDHAVTFVIDTVQKIYARGFTWVEAGFVIDPGRFHTLYHNHRNTRQIAAFAMGVLRDMHVDPDGALPDLTRATRDGELPVVLRGLYRQQIAWAIHYIKSGVDLARQSVAFLAPQATWLNFTKDELSRNGIAFVDLTREPQWPGGDENVALCTFHSAKGLEFDHVFILGLSAENTITFDEDVDDESLVQRRLLAVAIARAREFVAIGYKPGEESHLVRYIDPALVRTIDL